jgi:hypothetical protein
MGVHGLIRDQYNQPSELHFDKPKNACIIRDNITNKINNYDQKKLKGVNLFKYWRSDFENFTTTAYKKSTTKTKLLRDYLLNNSIWIPKNKRLIANNLIASAKL